MRWFSFCKSKSKSENKKSKRDNRKMTTRKLPTKVSLNANKGPRTRPLLSPDVRLYLDDIFLM